VTSEPQIPIGWTADGRLEYVPLSIWLEVVEQHPTQPSGPTIEAILRDLAARLGELRPAREVFGLDGTPAYEHWLAERRVWQEKEGVDPNPEMQHRSPGHEARVAAALKALEE